MAALALIVIAAVAFGAATGLAGAALVGVVPGASIAGGGPRLIAGLEAIEPGSGPVTAPAEAGESELIVHVAGAVRSPGLHRLTAGARIGDAIEVAGGFDARVDLDGAARELNLAAPLADGSKVLVPSLRSSGDAPPPGDGRIDLNRADRAALETLPGIGPVTAQRILDARREAPFARVEDLRARGIVGASVFERISDLVRAGA